MRDVNNVDKKNKQNSIEKKAMKRNNPPKNILFHDLFHYNIGKEKNNRNTNNCKYVANNI